MWTDWLGTNYTTTQVVDFLAKAVGATKHVLDHIGVGGVYRNGGIWFQRLE